MICDTRSDINCQKELISAHGIEVIWGGDSRVNNVSGRAQRASARVDQADPLCFATGIRSHPGQNATLAFVENNNQPMSTFSQYVNYSIKMNILNHF